MTTLDQMFNALCLDGAEVLGPLSDMLTDLGRHEEAQYARVCTRFRFIRLGGRRVLRPGRMRSDELTVKFDVKRQGDTVWMRYVRCPIRARPDCRRRNHTQLGDWEMRYYWNHRSRLAQMRNELPCIIARQLRIDE